MIVEKSSSRIFIKTKYELTHIHVRVEVRILSFNIIDWKLKRDDFVAFMKPLVTIYDKIQEDTKGVEKWQIMKNQ